MTRKDIIRMVRKASNNSEFTYVSELNDDLVCIYIDELEKFAKLVAKHEREKCAKVCDKLSKDMTPIASMSARACGVMIRAREQA